MIQALDSGAQRARRGLRRTNLRSARFSELPLISRYLIYCNQSLSEDGYGILHVRLFFTKQIGESINWQITGLFTRKILNDQIILQIPQKRNGSLLRCNYANRFGSGRAAKKKRRSMRTRLRIERRFFFAACFALIDFRR